MKSEPVTGNYRAALDVRTISGQDLTPGQRVTMTVSAVTREEVHDRNGSTDDATTMILSLHFEGTDRFLGIANKVNSQMMAKIAGTGVTRDWVGKHVTLTRLEKSFFGNPPGVIRLAPPTAEEEAKAEAASARRRGDVQQGAADAMEMDEEAGEQS